MKKIAIVPACNEDMIIRAHFSVAISELKEPNKKLAQQLGLLRQEIGEK